MTWLIAAASTSPPAVATAAALASPAATASSGIAGLTAPIATMIAAVIGFVGGLLVATFNAKATIAGIKLKAQKDLEQMREKAAIDLDQLQKQAATQIANARKLALEEAAGEFDAKNEQARRAIADRLETIGTDMRTMRKAIETLCLVAKDGRALRRFTEPARFLEVAWGLHLPVARFRVLFERYDDVKEGALHDSPRLWNLWSVAEAMEQTLIADAALAALDPVCAYEPAVSRAKDAAPHDLARTLFQDLNPEKFLAIAISGLNGNPPAPLLRRYSELRDKLASGSLDPGFVSARRVIEPFSVTATPVFWRVLIAELLLIDLFMRVKDGTFSDVHSLVLDKASIDPRPAATDAPDRPDDAQTFDEPVAAARRLIHDMVAGRLRPVV